MIRGLACFFVQPPYPKPSKAKGPVKFFPWDHSLSLVSPHRSYLIPPPQSNSNFEISF